MNWWRVASSAMFVGLILAGYGMAWWDQRTLGHISFPWGIVAALVAYTTWTAVREWRRQRRYRREEEQARADLDELVDRILGRDS